MVDLRDRFRGCMIGLAAGAGIGRAVDLRLPTLLVEALVAGGGDLDPFMKEFCKGLVAWRRDGDGPTNEACVAACEALEAGASWDESGVEYYDNCSAVRAPAIGLYHSDMTKVIEFAMESSRVTHSSLTAMCAAVGGAMMPYLAVKEVPVGLWANEIAIVTSKISDEFDEKIGMAMTAVAEGLPAHEALSTEFLGDGLDGHDAVACSLYCCLTSPNDFAGAISAALRSSDGVVSLVGASIGARLGMGAIPKEFLAGSEPMEALADKLYDARR